MRADRQWRGERATNFFKCASITIPITGAASDKNYPPTKVDKGSGGELTTHCASVGEKASRVGSDRIGSDRVESREKWKSERARFLSENYGMVGEEGEGGQFKR